MAATAMLAACAGDSPDGRRPDPAEASADGAFPDTVRGVVTLRETGDASFRPCGASRAYRVAEEPGADLDVAARGLAEPGTPLYAELQAGMESPDPRGPEDGFDGVLHVRRWVYLAEDTSSCARIETGPAPLEEAPEGGGPLPEGVAWRAQGNEPFWMAEVRGDRIVVTRPAVDTVSVPPVEPAVENGTRRWRAETEAHTLELRLNEEPCVDSMSGFRFGFAATLTLDGETFTGCARPGQGAGPEAGEAAGNGS